MMASGTNREAASSVTANLTKMAVSPRVHSSSSVVGSTCAGDSVQLGLPGIKEADERRGGKQVEGREKWEGWKFKAPKSWRAQSGGLVRFM